MEENEVMLLKNSKMYVTRLGRWMNVFSVFSLVVMLFLVIGGIAMLYVSNMMDENTPYYLDNILGLGGVGVIVGAGTIVPAVMYMRRAIRHTNQVKMSQEIYPVVNFMRESQKLWHYSSVVIIVLVVVAVLAAVVAAVYLLPYIQNM